MPFAKMFDESQICPILEHPHNGAFRKWRSFVLYQTPLRHELRKGHQRMCPCGVLGKSKRDHPRPYSIRLNIAGFVIIHIAHRSETQPLSLSQFLADTTLHILNQIVGKVFTLSERHLQHEFPLRGRFKPELRKAQRGNFVDVY